MIMKYVIALFVICCQLAQAASAPFPLGVATHFGQNRTDVSKFTDAMQRGGFNSIRDEVYWADVEKEAGTYALQGKAKLSFEMLRGFAQRGQAPMVVLSYGNALYDGGSQPYTDEGRQAFARYAAWVAQQMGPYPVFYEVWNEWNIGGGTRPSRRVGSPSDYVALLKATQTAIKAVNPKAVVVAGALGDDFGGWPWLQAALNAHMLDFADGLSVHLYNYLIPLNRGGGDQEFIDRLTNLKAKVANASKGRDIPIFVTEIGWPNHEGKGSVGRRDAATVAARLLTRIMSDKIIKGVWLYELFDGGNGGHDKENNFGLLDRNGTDKPVACAIRNLSKALQGASWVNTKTLAPSVQSYTFKTNDGAYASVVWQDFDGPGKRNRDSYRIRIKKDQAVQMLDCPASGESAAPSEVDITEQPLIITQSRPGALEPYVVK